MYNCGWSSSSWRARSCPTPSAQSSWFNAKSSRRVLLAVLGLGVLACSTCLGVAALADQPAGPSAADIRTEHYDLHIEGLDAADTARMLEQLYGQLSTYFGSAPTGRLSLAVYATKERWEAALRADQQYVPPNSGGYYAPYTKKAYLWIQPSVFSTRHLVLHEATHQFHYLTATANHPPSAEWYIEGLAEYFGLHNWDGQRLQTGVIPSITLEDYPSAAMKNFQATGSDLTKMLAHADRPEAWALVHFLLNNHADQFRSLAAKLDKGQDAAESWRQVFGDDTSRLTGEFSQWIKGHAQPWQIVWIPWQQRGDAIVADPATSALAVLKETPKTLTVELERQTAAGIAGLVFGYRSDKDFQVFQMLPGRKVRTIRRANGAWSVTSTVDLPPSSGPETLSVTQEGSSTSLWANGQKIATVAAAGQVGLNVERGPALFRIRQPR